MTDDFRKLFRIPVGSSQWGTSCEGPAFVRKEFVTHYQNHTHDIHPIRVRYPGWYRFCVIDEAKRLGLRYGRHPDPVEYSDGGFYYTLVPKGPDWPEDVPLPDYDEQERVLLLLDLTTRREFIQSRQELVDRGLLRDSGRRRPDRAGLMQIVWEITDKGKAALRDPAWWPWLEGTGQAPE